MLTVYSEEIIIWANKRPRNTEIRASMWRIWLTPQDARTTSSLQLLMAHKPSAQQTDAMEKVAVLAMLFLQTKTMMAKDFSCTCVTRATKRTTKFCMFAQTLCITNSPIAVADIGQKNHVLMEETKLHAYADDQWHLKFKWIRAVQNAGAICFS